uniref:Uncharacterized protein n=1 Tax=Poecilia reticulata TaxID=8081 RepID=A0A3P9P600_POERE
MIIKEKTLKIDPGFTMSEGKHQKFSKYMKSKFQFHKDSRLEKREHELTEVLQGTLRAGFIDMFPDTWRRMQYFLNELEQCAAQLDKMKEGKTISNVVGGTVAVAGHGFAIGGMALAPITLGTSFLLTFIGKMMAVASSANTLVTNLTKVGVNHTHQKKANKAFKSFLEDFQKIEYYLDGIPHPTVNLKPKKMAVVKGVGTGFVNAAGVATGVSSLIRVASSFRKSKASPQGAVKQDVGFSKGCGSFLAELIFVGMDISSVAKDSMDLAKGSKTKVSKFLRARIALLRSQIGSWDKIYNSLLETPSHTGDLCSLIHSV